MSDDEFTCQYCKAQLPAFVENQKCPECGSSLDLPDNNDADELQNPNSLAPGQSTQLDQRIGDRLKQRASKPAAISERDFGHFRLIDQIDRGPMGCVYKAKHSKSGDLVALKIIDSEYLQTDLEMDRFAIEAAACVALDHPGIVPVLEFGKVDSQQFVSMQHVDGLNLDEVLEDGPLSNEDALDMIFQITSAVRYAHQRDVIHRNLKPANILVVAKTGWSADHPQSSVGVTDFGLARQTDRQAHANIQDAEKRKSVSQYIAPEQIIDDWAQEKASRQRDQGVGAEVDIYSIGALLYAMLTGHPPHSDSTDPSTTSVMETLTQITSREPTPIRKLRPDVYPDLETICLKCLELDPQQRYESAEALLDELSRVMDDQPIETPKLTVVERFKRWQGLILGATLKSGNVRARDIRLRTSRRVLGLPLIDVAYGKDRLAAATETSLADDLADEFREDVDSLEDLHSMQALNETRGRARGIIAFGNQAIGVVAVGNRAYGLIAIGRRAFGLIAIGWTSIGLFSIGFLSLGVYALGGVSIGYHAAGILAIGYYAWGALLSIGWQAAGYWPWSIGGEAVDPTGMDVIE